jgi:hypothetical protein
VVQPPDVIALLRRLLRELETKGNEPVREKDGANDG